MEFPADNPEKLSSKSPGAENKVAPKIKAGTSKAPPKMKSGTSKTHPEMKAGTSKTPPKMKAGTSKAPPEMKAGTSKVEKAVPKNKVRNDSDSEKGDSQKLLDIAFAMDCTGSMGSQIKAAKENIRKIVEEIVSSEHADVHMALVEYRDHPPQDPTFITRPHDFTPSIRTMKGWLENCSAQGGGDAPEAVADALHDLVKLSWRPGSTRVAVLVSDAPPHGIGTDGDNFPNGCPLGLDSIEIGRQLAEKSVTVYTVGCSVSGKTRDFLMALSHMTGGQFVPLSNAILLSTIIISGAREEISIQALMDEVDQEVDEEMNALAVDDLADYEEVTKNIYSKLKAKGLQTNRMQPTSSSGKAVNLTPISPNAKVMSRMKNLDDLRRNYEDTLEDRSALASVLAPYSDYGMDDELEDDPIEVYHNVPDEVTIEQASRMVTKSIASRNLSAKMKK